MPTTFEGRPTHALLFRPPDSNVTCATYRQDGKWYMQEIHRYGHLFVNDGVGIGWKSAWTPEAKAYTLVTDKAIIVAFEQQLSDYQKLGFRTDPKDNPVSHMTGSMEEMRTLEEAAKRGEDQTPKKQKLSW